MHQEGARTLSAGVNRTHFNQSCPSRAAGEIFLRKVASKDWPIDVLTKPLTHGTHNSLHLWPLAPLQSILPLHRPIGSSGEGRLRTLAALGASSKLGPLAAG